MKTVIIYDQCGQSPLSFAVVEGDWSKYDRIYINDYDQELSYEFSEKVYDDSGNPLITFQEEFPYNEVKNGAKVIVAGFLP